jgi:hypothetical protein
MKSKESSFSEDVAAIEKPVPSLSPGADGAAVPRDSARAEESFWLAAAGLRQGVFFQRLAELSTEFRFRRICLPATAVVPRARIGLVCMVPLLKC